MIGIYTNIEKDINLKHTKALAAAVAAEGLDFACHVGLKGKITASKYFDKNNMPPLDIMIALGGDGTMLSASMLCSPHDIPLCGINLGKVGFLADIEPDDIAECVTAIKNKKYKIIERKMLGYSTDGCTGEALNELTISRNKAERSLNFCVRVRGEIVSSFFGDGFLISTPTGSTAYSLSAGGPIVASDVDCLLLTPLCAHSIFARSIIVSDKEEIVVTVDNPAAVIADGKLVCVTDNQIIVKKSAHTAKFAAFSNKNFYSKLRKKLNSISILPEEC